MRRILSRYQRWDLLLRPYSGRRGQAPFLQPVSDSGSAIAIMRGYAYHNETSSYVARCLPAMVTRACLGVDG